MTDWTKDPAMIEAMAKALHDASPFDGDKPEDYLPEAEAAASALPDFVVPKVDMAGLDGLVEQLRDEDSYYRVQEKHWCIDAEELERQRLAAANLIETQAREIERLREALKEVSEEWLGSEDCIPEIALGESQYRT